MGRRYRRREALAAGATGLVTATTGCLGLLSDSGPDLSTVDFTFTYEPGDGGVDSAVTIEHAGGDGLQAGNLRIRTGDGDEAVWSALGSTVEQPDELVTPGATARLGPDVVNWPGPVDPGETVRVLYAPSTESVTELDRYAAPTPTPSPTPTPTPTPSPTPTPTPTLAGQSVTGFESGDLSEWELAGVGETGDATWSVESVDPFEGEYAATYRGDRRRTIASTSGLERYPSRGDAFVLRRLHTSPRSGGGFGFGVPADDLAAGYRVHLRHAGWSDGPNTVRLRVRTGPGDTAHRDVAVTDFDVADAAGQYLRWEVEWGDPEIRVTAADETGEQVATLAASETTFDEGGVAIEGNTSEGSTVRYDALRVVPGGA